MFDKWLNLPAHLYLRITALTILIVGVALSNVLMSIGTIWIIANWLIEADFKAYWSRFKRQKTSWFIVATFFLLGLSLVWSADINYGFKDLRIKLPFIVIPLVMATSEPLEKKHIYFLLYTFVGIIIYTSVYNFVRYNYVVENATDIREMSTFISHVRYAILINFAFFTTLYLCYKKRIPLFLGIVIMGWLLFYLYKSQVVNGYLLFVVLSIITLIWVIRLISSIKVKIALVSAILVGVLIGGFSFYKLMDTFKKYEPVSHKDLDEFTALGNPYFHDTSLTIRENGNLVWIYVNQPEMEQAWNKRSSIKYLGVDKKQQPLFGTLMRYLTSKNSRKDAEGVNKLTDEEVRKIENGQTSVTVNNGLLTRVQTFLTELAIYKADGDPNGNSFIQRIEHIKAATGILKNHYLFGVGIGDVPFTFEKQYIQMNSRLAKEQQHRSHNQLLTLWISLGIVGLMLYLTVLLLPFFQKDVDFFAVIILVGLLIANLFQDLIETQAGVTIFALFYSLAVYRNKQTFS